MPSPALRAPTPTNTHGPSPVATKTCSLQGGQCTKSHALSGRSSPSTRRRNSPRSTRKVLLPLLCVVVAVRLPRPHHLDVDPELREPELVVRPAGAVAETFAALERHGGPEPLVMDPLRLAR